MITLRPALTPDVDAVGAVALAAYEIYTPRIGRMPAPMTADYAQAVREGNVWLATDDGKVVGFAVLIAAPDHLLVENIAVLPAAQGLGAGSRLLELAEEQAHRHGVPEIRLYTNEAMTENFGFYRRRGYVDTHRAQQDGFNRVFFRKTLGGVRVDVAEPVGLVAALDQIPQLFGDRFKDRQELTDVPARIEGMCCDGHMSR